jgi:hypothetical protein
LFNEEQMYGTYFYKPNKMILIFAEMKNNSWRAALCHLKLIGQPEDAART